MMKKYIFIFNSKFETFVSAKNSGSEINIELFNSITNHLCINVETTSNKLLHKMEPNSLVLFSKKIEIELKELLKQRDCSELSSEKSDWKSRFSEEQMVQSKIIFGIEYKLFIGGIDHKIFWFACLHELLNYSLKNKLNVYIYFSDKVFDVKRLQRILLRLETNAKSKCLK